MTPDSMTQAREFVAQYGSPDQAISAFMAGHKGGEKRDEFLDQNPEYFTDHLSKLIDTPGVRPEVIERAIRYARSYATCFYLNEEPAVPSGTMERIRALEERWHSKQRVAG